MNDTSIFEFRRRRAREVNRQNLAGFQAEKTNEVREIDYALANAIVLRRERLALAIIAGGTMASGVAHHVHPDIIADTVRAYERVLDAMADR